MDMKTYLKQASPEEREALAAQVGSSVGYFYLIGGGHRNAGKDLCKALVAADPKLTLHELRPDIWSPEMSATGSRPPESPVSQDDHPRRMPTNRDRIMTAATDQPPTFTRRESDSPEP